MNNLASLFFYIITFALSAYLVSFGFRAKKRIFCMLGLLIPIIIGGFRYGVGTDYFNYINIFSDHVKKGFVNIDGIEIGYTLLEQFSSLFAPYDTRMLFIITTALTIVFFYIGLVRFKPQYPGLVTFLYLMTLLPMSFNTVRQGIAVSIVFLALSYAKDKRTIPFVTWCVIASLFHISALLVIPFYFIIRIGMLKNNQSPRSLGLRYISRLIVMISITIAITVNALNLALSIPGFDKYELYTYMNEDGANLMFYCKLALLAVIFILSKYIILRDNVQYNTFIMSGAIMEIILLSLGFVSPFIKRQALYFSLLYIILLTLVVRINSNKARQALLYSVIACYAIGFFVVSYFILGQADIIPYKFSISGGKI